MGIFSSGLDHELEFYAINQQDLGLQGLQSILLRSSAGWDLVPDSLPPGKALSRSSGWISEGCYLARGKGREEEINEEAGKEEGRR